MEISLLFHLLSEFVHLNDRFDITADCWWALAMLFCVMIYIVMRITLFDHGLVSIPLKHSDIMRDFRLDWSIFSTYIIIII
jgi:hypothetical protein